MHPRRPYANTIQPLSTPKPAPKLGLPVTSTVDFVKRLGSLKLGALVGLSVTIIYQWLGPDSPALSWSEGSHALKGMVVGMTVEGLLHYFLGWYIEPRFHQLRARREAALQLEDLDKAEKDGVLSKEECARIRARITRREIAGGFKPRRRRGPNKIHPIVDPSRPVVFPNRKPRLPPAPPPAA